MCYEFLGSREEKLYFAYRFHVYIYIYLHVYSHIMTLYAPRTSMSLPLFVPMTNRWLNFRFCPYLRLLQRLLCGWQVRGWGVELAVEAEENNRRLPIIMTVNPGTFPCMKVVNQ